MTGGNQLIDTIEIDLAGKNSIKTIFIDVWDNNLSKKWLASLNHLLTNGYHLEKNYCFFGFADGPRDGEFICREINRSIDAINIANIGYQIDDYFTLENSLHPGPYIHGQPGGKINREKFNQLHRYFEDLQGISGKLSPFYQKSNSETRWHIRQLNLLCHEFESWALSNKKKITAPEWQRPSQLMCWLNAPRFVLDEQDYESFGIETMNRPLGGVYVGVNKAIGKHHWEVFVDEAGYDPDMIIDNLTTTTMRSQCEAAGDFDIEWANNPGEFDWQKKHLKDFRKWLVKNGFDPEDKTLTIGHPQCGQVDLQRSFDTTDYTTIWKCLSAHLDVCAIRTKQTSASFDYHWSDPDYAQKQIDILERH